MANFNFITTISEFLKKKTFQNENIKILRSLVKIDSAATEEAQVVPMDTRDIMLFKC